MKIANRHIMLVSGLFAWVLLNTPASVLAATASAAPPSMPAVSAPPVSSPASSSSQASSIALPSASPVSASKTASKLAGDPDSEIKIPDLTKPLPGGKGDKKDSKSADSQSAKVPDSVKEVIKHLSTKTEDVTLDDLNAAREAVAKLDALIDIERRLVDLDKIRNEREKENDKKLAEAIPKTALTPPPSYFPPPMMPERGKIEKAAPPPKPAPVELEIIRIEGSNSRYGALVRDNGAVRLVHGGDHLSDGSTIVSVTTQGVELSRDNTTHLTQIKDVQAVFGDSP